MKSVCASGRLPHFCWLAPMPLPNRPAARHREEAVRGLPAGALVVLERVGEVGQPLAGAPGAGAGEVERERRRRSPSTRRRAGPGAPTTQSIPSMIAIRTSAVPRSPPSSTSADDHHHHRGDRDQRVPPVVEQPLLAGVDVRAPQDDGELGHLGGLDRRPGPSASQLRLPLTSTPSRRLGEREQRRRDQQRRPGEEAQHPVRQPGGHERDRQRRARPRSAGAGTSSSCCRACTKPSTLEALSTSISPIASSRVEAPSSR